jgi:hypothetical protein
MPQKKDREEIATISELNSEIRNNPELITKAVVQLMMLYGKVQLDCGCIAVPPNADVLIVEMIDGSYIVVCSKCGDNVWSDDNFIGGMPTRLNC